MRLQSRRIHRRRILVHYRRQNRHQKNTKRVILCSGKIYYDLKAYRETHKIKDAAIIRVEQLYPLNNELLQKIIGKFPDDAEIVWCQEEPQNMGAWTFIMPRLVEHLGRNPRYAGRRAAASPAVGSLAKHKIRQAKLVARAFGDIID